MQDLSPKYIADLAKKVSNTIWDNYKSYDMVKFYISKWQKWDYSNDYSGVLNFNIVESTKGIELIPTLMNMDNETLIKIAIDLGIDTPGFIPCVPAFRNMLKAEYPTASEIFEKAYKKVYEDPSIAIGLANSALEGIIKEILKDERIGVKFEDGHTLKKLINLICKAFMEVGDMPQEIRTISSSLKSIGSTIDDLRSSKTIVHGKTDTDYIVSNPLYAELLVNSVASVGLFLQNYYTKNYPRVNFDNGKFDMCDMPPVPPALQYDEFDVNGNDLPF